MNTNTNFMRNLKAVLAPNFDSRLLEDSEGIYGCGMEYIWRMDSKRLDARSDEVRKAVSLLHEREMCDGDLSPSNVMNDRNGRLVLIGQDLPSHVHGGSVFNKRQICRG